MKDRDPRTRKIEAAPIPTVRNSRIRVGYIVVTYIQTAWSEPCRPPKCPFSHCELCLVDCVGFLVVSLTPLVPTFLFAFLP